MKNIFYFIAILILGSSQTALAQWEGQKFMSGSASIMFNNNNPDLQKSSNNYGYSFNVGLGKFKTSTRASGWNLNTSLSGSKQNFTTNNNGIPTNNEKNGINGFGVGVGRFWQFYKHFNEKVGIFVGPDVSVRYNNSSQYSNAGDGVSLIKTKTNVVSLSAGLSAGLYYKLSEKWWITGNIAVSNFVNTNYSIVKSGPDNRDYDISQKAFNYEFSPSFQFPSVGFGVRYFL
ncbi:porin family protein [Dyadobacter sp. CY356]|uniref:porin family protein n=1 Tax=Dyadobacter sp. CY356 TaxID=2906442 RepID=UPI001F2BBEBE|nr:porin family protein [Dyadobacter sp. CY356]MCF0057918.1 porin family protein [Dyadobacter sp. CY356]